MSFKSINITNSHTMPRTKKTTVTTIFALMTIVLLAYSGCKPEASSSTNSSKPVGDSSTSADSSTGGTEADSEHVSKRIEGDLGSVDWDSLVGQDITITGNLVVVDTYDLARRGQIKVSRDRLFIPTNAIDPNDADASATSFEGGSNVGNVTKAQKRNDDSTLIIDDGSNDENIFPPILFPNLGKSHPTVRIGSVIQEVSGKLVKERNKMLLVPNGPLQWKPAERPQRPEVGQADVTIASFNVLNYFTTVDDGNNGARGADTDSELNRQEAKLVSAIIALESDVVGLMELENNLESETRLVAALNQKLGNEVFKGVGLPDDFRSAPGGQDEIRVGIIYRTDRVAPVGKVTMIRDDAFELARTPVIQEFKPTSSDKPFTVIVNHFKSKGGSDRADVANKNKGDGQGAFNATRRSQALAICEHIDNLTKGGNEPRVLVIGDLNAYGQEDPIDAMRAKGLVDLQQRSGDQSNTGNTKHYSYIYYGQCGSLDHAIATEPFAKDVTGIATWHINADEPRFMDYNEEYNPESLFDANPFRSSDHDPVLIGLRNQ